MKEEQNFRLFVCQTQQANKNLNSIFQDTMLIKTFMAECRQIKKSIYIHKPYDTGNKNMVVTNY